jgi:hypothetical protein
MVETNYLSRLLQGKNDNHILPFLWLREQSEETLRTEIEKIYDCGIRAVCLESRPHPDFGGPGWWHDLDIVIDEAKKRGMKVWILDDAHFPTGMANGIIPAKYPELSRKYIMTQFTDCVGPLVSVNLDVGLMMTKEFKWIDFGKKIEKPNLEDTTLLSVTAYEVVHGDVISDSGIELTDHVKDGWLTWDVPAGVWRICVSFTTYDFGANNNYINYIDRKSVHALIEAVYELHYDHYKDEFGKTIAGFFSDEPGFYNVGGYQMHTAIGRTPGMALPWSEELQEVYEKSGRRNWKMELPYLWLDASDQSISSEQRRYYMDQVTKLYAKDFSCQLGDWCRDHGVKYIGHVVEDYEEHSRLGTGAGHYFRAMEGQSWAGIDDIGGQIIPGNPLSTRHGVTADSDAEFYHYMLAQLGSSEAAIDPEKHGSLMCEMFGAYGWNFGVKNMKWLTDFLVLQGVNQMVPHAFSMADYPDIDCPPHFYARGNNGQYPYFAELMKYANRLCDLLGNSQKSASVGVMYTAENDWMNESMKIQTIGKELLTSQMDYLILPTDIFANRKKYGVSFENGVLKVNGHTMKTILAAESRYIDMTTLKVLKEAAEAGVPVIFVGSWPEYEIGDGIRHALGTEDFAGMKLCPPEDLSRTLIRNNVPEIVTEGYVPELLATHYQKDGDIFCFFNTDLAKSVDTVVTLPCAGKAAGYDVMNNRLVSLSACMEEKDGRTRLHLHLMPYESLIVLSGVRGLEDASAYEKEPAETGHETADISMDWKVSAVRAIAYPDFGKAEQWHELVPYSRDHREFAGIIRYEKTVSLPDGAAWKDAVLDIEHVGENAEVFVNGKSAGKRLTPPYRWEIGDLLADGDNTIRVETANTPTRDTLHAPSPFGPAREVIEPSGIFGKIVIASKKKGENRI